MIYLVSHCAQKDGRRTNRSLEAALQNKRDLSQICCHHTNITNAETEIKRKLYKGSSK